MPSIQDLNCLILLSGCQQMLQKSIDQIHMRRSEILNEISDKLTVDVSR